MNDLRIDSQLPRTPEAASSSSQKGGRAGDFSRLISGVLKEANSDVVHAEQQARSLADGKAGIVETILALNKADTSLRFVVELRNKFVETYREITHLAR